MNDKYIQALKALSDASRLRIFWLLAQINEKITVAEAVDVLEESQYNVSRNLKLLQKANLLDASKDGKWVFYALKDVERSFYRELLESIRAIPASEFTHEIKRCKWRLTLREGEKCVLGADSDAWKALLARENAL